MLALPHVRAPAAIPRVPGRSPPRAALVAERLDRTAAQPQIMDRTADASLASWCPAHG
jgi:hypothetical protein